MVLSVIQGIALNTGVLPFSKGRALQTYMDKIQFLVEKTSGIDLNVSLLENT